MYAQYLKETLGQEYKEDGEGRGFLTYGYNCIPGVDFPHLYIVDLWVKPEHRKSHVAANLADEVCAEAKSKGIAFCFGSISKHSQTQEASKRVLKAYGMTKYAEDDQGIWFVKEIQ